MTIATANPPPPETTPDSGRWLEALPEPFIGLDEGDRIDYANVAATELLAGVGRGLRGRSLRDVFGADAVLSAVAHRARRGASGVAESDIEIVGPGFSLGRFNVTAAPVGEHGHVALALSRPPRPRKAPPLSAQGSAARTLAHEVRNPLAGIRAAAQLIERGSDNEAGALAQLICAEVDRIHRLTERIDPLGGFALAPFESLNIHEVLDRVRKLVQSSAHDLSVREHYDPSLPPVRGDKDQLIQAFLNIAKNAAEALAGRSDARLDFVTAYRPGIHVRNAPDGIARAQLEVQIADNGPGIDPAVAERMFEPFASTKTGGMGLGLAVAAEIVSRHEGRIEVDTRPGRTVFRVLLPIEAQP